MSSSNSPGARVRGAASSVGQSVALLIGTVLVAVFGGLLLAGLFAPAVFLTSEAADDGLEFFDSLPGELEVEPLNESSRIEAADGTLLATFFSQNRILVPLERISPHMQHAIIAEEDRRFYEHGGVDPRGLARALVSNAAGGGTQGGSTLTQQYVKNALLMDAVQRGDEEDQAAATAQTYGRKLREAKLAITLEKKLSKDEILNRYLNVAQFGPSQYGVETASRHYFNKNAADLSIADAALLAGVTNAPNLYDPVSNPEGATERRDQILWQMQDQGYITEEEYEQARATPLDEQLDVTQQEAGCASAGTSGFFCDYVTRTLLDDPAFGETPEERQELLYGGGLTIRTTLDPQTQQVASELLERKLPADNPDGFGHAIVTVEPGTGKIRTMAQNRTFNPYPDPPVGQTAVNYAVGQRYGGGVGFEVGSVYKPMVLTEWLKQGHGLLERVPTPTEKVYDTGTFRAHCVDGGRYTSTQWPVTNSVSVPLQPSITALDATKFSVNTTYVEMTRRLDLCSISDTAESMGLQLGAEDPRTGSRELAPMPSASLGSYNIAPLDMAAAYAVFAADGTYCRPQAIESIVDSAGEELPFTGTQCEQVLEPEVAQGAAWTLQQDLEDPRATGRGRVIPGHDAGGKTGTSSFQYHTWYLGFTEQMSTAVWFGHPNRNVDPGGVQVDGRTLRGGSVWGNTVALPTWQEYMTDAHAVKELPNIPFPQAPASVLAPHPDAVPAVAGLNPDQARGVLEGAGYRVRIDSSRIDSTHPAGTVAETSPLGGAVVDPGAEIVLRISTGRSPVSPEEQDEADTGGEGV